MEGMSDGESTESETETVFTEIKNPPTRQKHASNLFAEEKRPPSPQKRRSDSPEIICLGSTIKPKVPRKRKRVEIITPTNDASKRKCIAQISERIIVSAAPEPPLKRRRGHLQSNKEVVTPLSITPHVPRKKEKFTPSLSTKSRAIEVISITDNLPIKDISKQSHIYRIGCESQIRHPKMKPKPSFSKPKPKLPRRIKPKSKSPIMIRSELPPNMKQKQPRSLGDVKTKSNPMSITTKAAGNVKVDPVVNLRPLKKVKRRKIPVSHKEKCAAETQKSSKTMEKRDKIKKKRKVKEITNLKRQDKIKIKKGRDSRMWSCVSSKNFMKKSIMVAILNDDGAQLEILLQTFIYGRKNIKAAICQSGLWRQKDGKLIKKIPRLIWGFFHCAENFSPRHAVFQQSRWVGAPLYGLFEFAMQMKAKKCHNVLLKLPMYRNKNYGNDTEWAAGEVDNWSDDGLSVLSDV